MNLAITGTPGTRKSIFLLYILIREVLTGNPVIFLRLSNKMNGYFTVELVENGRTGCQWNEDDQLREFNSF